MGICFGVAVENILEGLLTPTAEPHVVALFVCVCVCMSKVSVVVYFYMGVSCLNFPFSFGLKCAKYAAVASACESVCVCVFVCGVIVNTAMTHYSLCS